MVPNEEIVAQTGAWTTALLAALAAIRFAWLRVSKDKIILAGDAADLSAIQRLKDRVDDLDNRLKKEENQKRKIAVFMLRAMHLIVNCNCDDSEAERAALEIEFETLMKEISS